MRPPICEICSRSFNPDNEGGLLYFKKKPEGIAFDKRVEKEGIIGHPPYAGWFCGTHYKSAEEYTLLTINEAITKMRKINPIRQFLASIAYHATKAIRDAPDNYPEFEVGMDVRTPLRLLHHITGVLIYADSFYSHYDTTRLPLKKWSEDVEQFYKSLSNLDNSLKTRRPHGATELQLLQGPLSDAMAHTGQLLMLRRLACSPVPSENFIYADIRAGNVGPDQPDPVAPDE